MAVAFDAVSNSGYQAAQSTYSWNHTCAGSKRYLRVAIGLLTPGESNVSSVVYGGVYLSKRYTSDGSSGSNIHVEEWHLVEPPTGTHSVVVTLASSLNTISAAESLTGVDQHSPALNPNASSGDGTGSPEGTLVANEIDSEWILGCVFTKDTSIAYSGDLGLTERVNVSGAGGSLSLVSGGPIVADTNLFEWNGISNYWVALGFAVPEHYQAYTRLGPGVGLAAYGEFVAKDFSAFGPHNPGIITRLAQFGVGVAKYGTFIAKAPNTTPDATNAPMARICSVGRLMGRF